MKVLFLHNNDGDYLAVTLLHGLRSLLGDDCVDVPRYDCMYKPFTERLRSRLRGHGFTVYGLLEDIPSLHDARHWWQKTLNDYDIIVIADIWAQWDQVWQIADYVDDRKLFVLDGADAPTFFPNAFHLLKRPWAYLTPISRYLYFKRELIAGECSHRSLRFLKGFRKNGLLPANARTISFSIPAEKIWAESLTAQRTKDFPAHIVDAEISSVLQPEASGQYTFSEEDEYYGDLRKARFGITVKRGGWDCLRHYELAANGCVLCFRDLAHKPLSCAPHGLDQENCIIYHDYDELRSRIAGLTEADYKIMQLRTHNWISQNTTIERAEEFIQICTAHSK